MISLAIAKLSVVDSVLDAVGLSRLAQVAVNLDVHLELLRPPALLRPHGGALERHASRRMRSMSAVG
jgi:hypothetical protein